MSAAVPARARRHDPQRRERIVECALDVIAEHGVAGTSHRMIAARAGVSLGSMTYHFAGIRELLLVAFSLHSERMSERFGARISEAASGTTAPPEALVSLVASGVFASDRDVILSHELYMLATRDDAFRDITTAWMNRSRKSLERLVDPETARLVDALIEGLTIHRALHRVTAPDSDIAEGFRRLLNRPNTQAQTPAKRKDLE